MERRKFTREFKLEAVRLIKERGVSYAQASHDLSVHQSQLRTWVKALADDPQHAFPGQGQMKPEQLEIAQLKREVIRTGRQKPSPTPKTAAHEVGKQDSKGQANSANASAIAIPLQKPSPSTKIADTRGRGQEIRRW